MTVRHLLGGAVLAAAATMLLTSSASAQVRNFSFTSAFTPSPVPSNQGGTSLNVINGANASLTTPTSIVLTNFTTTSNAPTNTPATFNSAYSLLVNLTDIPTGQTIQQTLTGTITGTASSSSASLAASFNQSSLTFQLANGVGFYTISNFNFISPSDPGSTTQGAIGANTVSFTSTQAPEPGSLALVATGMMGAMGMVVRRRRSAK